MAEQKAPTITKKQLLPYVKKAWKELQKVLAEEKKRLGERYNNRNIYEQFPSLCNDPAKEPEKFFDEYMLCLNKVNPRPARVRNVIVHVGNRAVNIYLWNKEMQRVKRLQKKEQAKAKE